MEAYAAFKPGGVTIAIDAPTSNPPTGVQLAGPNAGDVSVLIFNTGTNLVWLGYGNTAAGAATNAVAPTSSAAQQALACPAGYTCFTFSPKTFFSALAITGAQTIQLTPGQGKL